MSKQNPPTLTDRVGMGGVNAGVGFDYQVWDAIARLPSWVRQAAFDGLIVEGLEDLEARFVAPHAENGFVTDRYQHKSAVLAPSEVRGVFESFARFDKAFPHRARSQVLVTPMLPPTLQWLKRDADRVRNARPFYAPFQDVWLASERAFEADVASEYGPDLGRFVASAVDIHLRPVLDRQQAEVTFAAELARWHAGGNGIASLATDAFGKLERLLRARTGRLITRQDVAEALGTMLAEGLDLPAAVPLRMLSDSTSEDSTTIELDTRAFSAKTGAVPSEAEWRSGLIEPLLRLRKWARETGRRRFRISGSCRLPTGFVLGWGLRATNGFDLEIPTRSEYWATDASGDGAGTSSEWRVTEPAATSDDTLAVCIGVLRDPSPDVLLHRGDENRGRLLHLQLDRPIEAAADIQRSVQHIKLTVSRVARRTNAKHVDLFMATPAALAIALGHRWNAMPRTRVYEHREGAGYFPAAVLESHE